MGFLARLRVGWRLAMDSFGVLRADPELAVFPLVGGLAGVVYVGLLLGGSALLGLDRGPALYAVLFVTYLGSSFVAAFFTAGLTYSVREAFAGREPSVRSGLAAAWEKRAPLFVWAVASAIVGVVLRVMERQDNLVSRLVAGLFGVAWSILTYFIIPVIVFEDVDAWGMFRRSGETFRETWGETAGAGFGVGVVTIAFTLVGLAVAGGAVVSFVYVVVPNVVLFVGVFVVFGSTLVGVAAGLVLVVLVVFSAYLLGTTLGGIAKVALYQYATEGVQPAQFDDVDFNETVR